MAIDNYIPKVGDTNRIDNTPAKTMRGAIAGLMEESGFIRIASGYFRLSGIVQLEEDFRRFFERSKNNKIQLLISNQFDRKDTDTRKLLGIAGGKSEYSNESFYLDNYFYQELVNWIKLGRIDVKIFVDSKFYETHSKDDIAFLHGKAYLFSRDFKDRRGDVLIGSSNFTYGGLVENRELNIFSQDSFPPIKDWFDEMWENYSEQYSQELLMQLEEQKRNYSKPKTSYTPVSYFYWNLGKYFGEKRSESLTDRISMIEENLPYPRHKNGKKFFVHQSRGISRVYTKLKEFDAQILADGVGLGKTLEAASIIKLYLQDLQSQNDKRKVLILANDRLKEQWITELENVQVNSTHVDITTRQKFTRLDNQSIKDYAETYALVVIDEAHEGFLRKNNEAYKKIQEMLHIARENQGRTIRGLLLTATPWNNSREDVIRLGLLFLNIQKVPTSRQYYDYVLGEREKLLYDTKDNGNYNQNAYIEFWNDLFTQRTRSSLANEKFLSERYPKREFPLEREGIPFTITYSSDVSSALNDILGRIIELKLPYQDTVWQYFGPNTESNVILRQRYQLLRRADSSNAAFGKSLENIKNKLEDFQKDIEALKGESLVQVKKYFYEKINSSYAKEFSDSVETFDLKDPSDSDIDTNLNKAQNDRVKFIDEKLSEQTLDAYLSRMLTDTIIDIHNLSEVLAQWNIVSKNDEKQRIIIKQIKKLVAEGNKVLVFSEFSDTVENYYQEMLADSTILKSGIGMIYGGVNRINYENCSKQEVLGCFSPHSKSYELDDKKEISVLIGTDAISTGQNLQDANHLVTIELPYNPMRLEQRIGRIDRPKLNGENHIYIYAFPSEEVINAELRLSERFEGKAKGATQDTYGDFKLPFVHNGYYEGLSALNNTRNLDSVNEELITSVSEEEARERVFDFYQKFDEKSMLGGDFTYFPESFTAGKDSILLFKAVLQDINQHSIQTTPPTLWDMINNRQLSFVEAENITRKLLKKDFAIDKSEAKKITNSYNKARQDILEKIITNYNDNLKSISKLEIQPAYIMNLREILMNGRREYRNNFVSQKIDGRQFTKVVNSLGNRGFNKEQSNFLKILRGDDGNISSKKVFDNIWNNLKRFMDLFNGEIVESNISPIKNKASKDNSKLEIIAEIIGVQSSR